MLQYRPYIFFTWNFALGLLTNIGTMVIAPYQYAEFSSKTRTALYRNGQYLVPTQPGAYRFAKFIIMDHGSALFQVSKFRQ